jgi:hypothetical protein
VRSNKRKSINQLDSDSENGVEMRTVIAKSKERKVVAILAKKEKKIKAK